MDEEIENRLSELVEKVKSLQGKNLVGIYLHGSLAMDCFNPESSDVDLLIVTKSALSSSDKDALGNFFIDFQREFPNKLDISCVTRDALQNFQYPTPYELRFRVGEFIPGGVDSDLAASFVFTKKRGSLLYGEPINDVFPDVSDEHYLESLTHDFEWSLNNVLKGEEEGLCEVPTYAVLNFCRILAFVREGLIPSKKEGGEWGLEDLPEEYSLLITEALKEYAKKGSSSPVDAKTLKNFARYTEKELKQRF